MHPGRGRPRGDFVVTGYLRFAGMMALLVGMLLRSYWFAFATTRRDCGRPAVRGLR